MDAQHDIGFRPIQADDADRLVGAFERLSASSRYRRFLAPVNALSETEVRHFTQVDFVDHVAWVAELIGEPGRPFAGVGRWIRSRADPAVAELALTVVDAYQRQGLGTALLKLLAEAALLRGVQWFEGTVLGENQPMRALLHAYGAVQVGYDMGAYVLRVRVAKVVGTL
jgi:RimJ/RimL family protein N-acetyltransferase